MIDRKEEKKKISFRKPQLRNISTYAHALFLGIRSEDLTSSILAATMKSFMLRPPAV